MWIIYYGITILLWRRNGKFNIFISTKIEKSVFRCVRFRVLRLFANRVRDLMKSIRVRARKFIQNYRFLLIALHSMREC